MNRVRAFSDTVLALAQYNHKAEVPGGLEFVKKDILAIFFKQNHGSCELRIETGKERY